MSIFYRLAYSVGLAPWEEMATLPIGKQIADLFDREEDEQHRPYGALLDLGCGRGIWSTTLAARGWQVTGIELVPKAARAASRRVRQAGVEARIIQGDMTALRRAGVGVGFRFVLDLGGIHGLSDAQRDAVGREVTAVTTGGATRLILARTPAQRGLLPRGMRRSDIEGIFPQWQIIAEDAADVSGAPGFVKKAKPRFYRLRRT